MRDINEFMNDNYTVNWIIKQHQIELCMMKMLIQK